MAGTNGAIVVHQQGAALAAADEAVGWSPEQTALIKRTVAPDSTNDELAIFLHVAQKAGLDPLQKQIWFVKRKQKVTKNGHEEWEDRVTIQAGVDGLQARALRMPDCDGIRSAAVYENEDFVFDKKNGEVVKHEGNPFKSPGRPVGAWSIVERRGKKPFCALVRFDEYVDERSFLWKGKPGVMIEKVARSTALRRAYPEAFGGIYDPAEMGRAAQDAAHNDAKPEPVAAEVVALPPPPPEPTAAQAAVEEADAVATLAGDENDRLLPATSAEVDALWSRLLTDHTGDKAKATADWKAAAVRVFGKSVPVTQAWKRWQLADVERYLFPPGNLNDIPF